ncbi:Metallo-dependent phosphatase [Copromyces sp. CBS 386.78]|nr:Metallo-dependent phosphatase [Copromyces sp. CBS 386.78]
MAPHHQDHKDHHPRHFPAELPHHHINHQPAIKYQRRSQFWKKFLTASSFGAILFLLTSQADQAHGHQQPPTPTPSSSDLLEPPPLTFSKGNTFQISIFQDLHFGENAWEEWGPLQDLSTTRVMNTVLDSEPATNLVVLNGDLISGENTYQENSTRYVDQIVEPMVRRGLTWASTYGNHDGDFNLSREGLWEEERKWLGSRTGRMVPTTDNEEEAAAAGVTNYYLPVYPAGCGNRRKQTRQNSSWYRWAANIYQNLNLNLNQNQNAHEEEATDCTAPSLLLWFFDSRGGIKYQQRHPVTGHPLPEPNWVHQSVVDWFTSTSASISAAAGGRVIPSIGFVHIPTNASLALQDSSSQKGGVDANRQPGINDDVPVAQQGQGWCGANGESGGGGGEWCDYGEQDVPFMEAIASTPGMMALFSGHDHGNTWCYKWDGQVPGTSQQKEEEEEEEAVTGDEGGQGNGQGHERYGSWIRGSRQVVVDQEELKEFVIRTHIRLENGEVVGAVTLNATYGEDKYPVTPNEKTHLLDSALEDF